MKAEINNENKAKFFALYYDQCVLFTASFVKSYDISNIKGCLEKEVYGEELYLQLKPLSQISDEDAFNVSVMAENIGSSRNGFIYIESYKYRIQKLPINVCDYLRSRGYALPWMGLSVEEQIKAGWIKLTSC